VIKRNIKKTVGTKVRTVPTPPITALPKNCTKKSGRPERLKRKDNPLPKKSEKKRQENQLKEKKGQTPS
jgi:hypothetical protein